MSKIHFEIQIIDKAFPAGGFISEGEGKECHFEGFDFQCAYAPEWPWHPESLIAIYHVESGTQISRATNYTEAYRKALIKLNSISLAILQAKIKLALQRKFKFQLQTQRNMKKGYMNK